MSYVDLEVEVEVNEDVNIFETANWDSFVHTVYRNIMAGKGMDPYGKVLAESKSVS